MVALVEFKDAPGVRLITNLIDVGGWGTWHCRSTCRWNLVFRPILRRRGVGATLASFFARLEAPEDKDGGRDEECISTPRDPPLRVCRAVERRAPIDRYPLAFQCHDLLARVADVAQDIVAVLTEVSRE